VSNQTTTRLHHAQADTDVETLQESSLVPESAVQQPPCVKTYAPCLHTATVRAMCSNYGFDGSDDVTLTMSAGARSRRIPKKSTWTTIRTMTTFPRSRQYLLLSLVVN
jgi:hypothetical protein